MARSTRNRTTSLIYSEYRVSLRRIDDYIKQRVVRGTKTQTRELVAKALFPTHDDNLREYKRAVRDNRAIRIAVDRAGELLESVPDELPVEPEKLLAAWAPAEVKRAILAPRAAEYGEIEVITESSENLIDPARHPLAAQYVAAYVDQVRFFQARGDAIDVYAGEYVRIEVPSGLSGAVVLPVEVDTGDVLLVTQYRHSAQRFLTECPRGFGHIGADRDSVDTARRELREETGRLPIRTLDGVEQLFFLKSSYADTGKLWERPDLYLAYVRRGPFEAHLNQWNPAMEDPVWLRLPSFVKGLYAQEPLQLETADFTFASLPRHLAKMRPETPISRGFLSIEDAFTLQAGLLALPLLRKRFPRLLAVE